MSFFQRCRDFVAHGLFVDQSLNVTVHNKIQLTSEFQLGDPKKWRYKRSSCTEGTGFEALQKASIPEAIHDSSARDPPRCFPGTREEHIRNITGWGAGDWEGHQARLLWLQGPAGVGKSALAQTCAERIGDRLGASFFFSRLNGWNNPTGFIPTIVYQLATKSEAYRNLVDAIIVRDPLVLQKSIGVQFRELLVKPLEQLSSQDHGISENVIIVDGLDECDGQDAQCVIIEIIATSILQRSTPFLWAFFSRPEPHIVSAFSSKRIAEISWRLTLPVSRSARQDIEAYLRDGFRMIRARYNLPAAITWPSEEDIRQLVCQSSGLFVHAASVIRQIARNPGALGPEQRLQSILELRKAGDAWHPANALSNLDQFYILIMEQIPKEILPNTLLLLFVHLHCGKDLFEDLPVYCPMLNLSPIAAYAALNNLHSVLEVQASNSGVPGYLLFYHVSFADFLCDVTRSTQEFCVETQDIYNQFYSACVDTLCRLPIASANKGT